MFGVLHIEILLLNSDSLISPHPFFLFTMIDWFKRANLIVMNIFSAINEIRSETVCYDPVKIRFASLFACNFSHE